MKILVGCNLLTEVKSLAYTTHMQFWFNLGKQIKPEDKIIYYTPRRMSIDRMRNEAAKMALDYECDYLFFYDDDVLLPVDALSKLIETHRKMESALVVGGLTLVRSMPFNPMIFKYVQTGSIHTMTCFNDFKDYKDNNGIVACDALGFSCCLIDVDALKMMHPPYFVTGPENTEDVYFCHKINTEIEGLPDPRIVVDTNVTTGHILDHHFISALNKPHFERLEKGLQHHFDEQNIRKDRNDNYREQVMERLRTEETVQ